MSAFGKIVGEAQYVHKSALGHLEQDALIRVRKAIEVVPDGFNWNVVKIDLKNEASLSFLEYTDFELHAFPILLSSCNVNAENKDVKYRNYSKSNPPILHRKELLISNDFPEYSKFFSLTKELEELGAFENIVELGTKQRWEKALQDLGIRIENHQIVVHDLNECSSSEIHVFRHRTALKRKKLSSCMGALIDSSLVNKQSQIFDYGCGKGDDVAILKFSEFENVSGWDPHFAKDNHIPTVSEFVNLSFVLNVIENIDERNETLKNAFEITSKALVFSVMLTHQNTLQYARPYLDGFISSINTFQKFYTPAEIEELVETVLGEKSIKMGAGIYIVFKDKELEQEYLFKKQLGLLSEIKSPPKEEVVERYSVELVDRFVAAILQFGRIPKFAELPTDLIRSIQKTKVSINRLARLALSQVSVSELSQLQDHLSSEILIFLAVNRFDGRVKYGDLPARMQNDVKAHFGSIKSASEEAEKLLFSLSDIDLLSKAAIESEQAGKGYLVDEKFRFHSEQADDLPVPLKLFLKIGERLHRSIQEDEVIQLHLESKKVSFLRVDDFAYSPLPRIHSREIINFLNLDVANVLHAEQKQVRILYNKSHLMSKKHKMFTTQKTFDENVQRIISSSFEGREPRFEDFAKALINEKITLPSYR